MNFKCISIVTFEYKNPNTKWTLPARLHLVPTTRDQNTSNGFLYLI